MSDEENEDAAKKALAAHKATREKRAVELPKIREDGLDALNRLMFVAKGHSGQCRRVAAFLLSLYNGSRFPFDLTDMRAVDADIFDDCMLVLRMDSQPQREVHTYFPNGGKLFEQLAIDWRIADMQRLRQHAERVIESGLNGFNGDVTNLAHHFDLALKNQWDEEDL